ncbi:MAG: response regulator transcription factor [Chloroflexi bacterium]|nr:response regulator transcription factor [Chloroflexota bacterium]
MELIRVVLADDYIPFRTVIRRLLDRCDDIEVVGEAGCGEDALFLVQEKQPDVLVLDMELPGIDGIEVSNLLHGSQTPVSILAFSAYNDRYYVKTVLENGASGYLIKDEPPHKIVEAVRRVAKGEKGWFSQEVVPYLP